MDLSGLGANLLTPPILFFLLGMGARLLRSDLEIPQPVTRALSLYLLFAIGLHGGVELSRSGFTWEVIKPLAAGIGASILVPVAAFAWLRRRFGAADAAAIGATYGSISAVTFVTAAAYLSDQGVPYGGHMVAAMALMESPAILVGVLLARRFGDLAGTDGDGSGSSGDNGGGLTALLREAFVNGPVFLLLGSLLIGLLSGEEGWQAVAPFAYEPFKGVLCLFLLDMGLISARRLSSLRESGLHLASFALVVPLVNAALAIGVGHALGLSEGDALLLTVLCASGSYIAVPAAVRVALPQANVSLYLPMSLALTFPFNIAVGIPLYHAAIRTVWSVP